MIELKRFIELVEDDLFGKAHEALEQKWLEYKRNNNYIESKIVQGFINGATSLELFRRGRIEPSTRVWKTFEKYEPLIKQGKKEYLTYYKEIRTLLHNKRDQQLKRV